MFALVAASTQAALLPSRLDTRAAPRRNRAPPPRAPLLTNEEALDFAAKAWALVGNLGTEEEYMVCQMRGNEQWFFTWENEADALRYAEMLSAGGYPETTPTEIDTHELLTSCWLEGHTLCVVPESTLVIPPEYDDEPLSAGEFRTGGAVDFTLEARPDE